MIKKSANGLILTICTMSPLAYAQSNVSIFGIIDVNWGRSTGGDNGSRSGINSGGLQTSRIGFRGVEDLGGGFYAGFALEARLNVDTGTGGSTTTNNQDSGVVNSMGLMFDRESLVKIGHNAWGEVRMGRDYSPSHWNSIVFDAFNATGVGRSLNFTAAGIGASPLQTNISVSNTLSYTLPKNSVGIYGVALIAKGENDSTSFIRDDGNVRGGRIGFKSGKFDTAIALTRTTYEKTRTLGNMTHANLGMSYDFGIAQLYGLYNNTEIELVNGDIKKKASILGVQIPIFKTGRVRASVGWLNDVSDASVLNQNGTPRSSNDARQVAIGYVHELSRRTSLYGTYARIKNEGQAPYVVSGGVAPKPGQKSSGMEFGIRHAF
jgi:predicted porin